MGKYFVILSLLWFGCCFAVQQDSTAVQYDHQSRNTVPFTQEDIESFTQDNDYNYEPQTVDNSWWVALKNWFYNLLRAFFEWLFGVDAAPNYIAVFLKYLPYFPHPFRQKKHPFLPTDKLPQVFEKCIQ